MRRTIEKLYEHVEHLVLVWGCTPWVSFFCGGEGGGAESGARCLLKFQGPKVKNKPLLC